MTEKRWTVSDELIRRHLLTVDKFELRRRQLDLLAATQEEREIGALHTMTSAWRDELDYTKYAVFIFPDERWNEPLLFQTGFGISHFAACIKGVTVTLNPSRFDTVRLYKNVVLPKPAVFPTQLHEKLLGWDAYGSPALVAIDNGPEFIAGAAMLMFLSLGSILLRLPPRRGDMKGRMERTIQSMETMYISNLKGYVPSKYRNFDSRYNRQRLKSKCQANLTVTDYLAKLIDCVMEFNETNHPKYKKKRAQVWRDGQEQMPLLMPTGAKQIRSIFATTHQAALTREGVAVNDLQYNSQDLHKVYLTHPRNENVIVKFDPDDVSKVLVIIRKEEDSPIEAFLTTFRIEEPMTIELLRHLRSGSRRGKPDEEVSEEEERAATQESIDRLGSTPVKHDDRQTVQAAKVAAQPKTSSEKSVGTEGRQALDSNKLSALDDLLNDSKLDD